MRPCPFCMQRASELSAAEVKQLAKTSALLEPVARVQAFLVDLSNTAGQTLSNGAFGLSKLV